MSTNIDNFTAGAFSECSGLTSIQIPNSLIRIGGSAFEYCTGLKNIYIGENVTSIGSRAFYKCTALVKINWNAKNVDEFSYRNGIFSYAGQNSSGIEVVFGNKVKSVPAYAFYPEFSDEVPNVTSITFGNCVEIIGTYAFQSSSGLKYVSIPKSVKTIDTYAFFNCKNLYSIQIGDSSGKGAANVNIKSSTFSNCAI